MFTYRLDIEMSRRYFSAVPGVQMYVNSEMSPPSWIGSVSVRPSALPMTQPQ
jgi:hypothetical protein